MLRIVFSVPGDTIGAIIGSGGKIIQELQAETNTNISIEDVDGEVELKLQHLIKQLLMKQQESKAIAFPPTVEIGEVYKTIMPYGAFVEVLPGIDGLLHVSELDWRRVENVEDILNEGESVKFKVVGRDPKTGKIKLSRKVLLEKPEGYVEPSERPRRGDRGDRRERGDRRRRRNEGSETKSN